MSNNVIVGSENIEGNITSCKIENQLKLVKKNSAFSIQQTSTYMTYDVCNKHTIAEYTVPEFTGMAPPVLMFLVVFVGMVVMMVRLIFDW